MTFLTKYKNCPILHTESVITPAQNKKIEKEKLKNEKIDSWCAFRHFTSAELTTSGGLRI